MHSTTSITGTEVPYGSAVTPCARESPPHVGATYAGQTLLKQFPIDGLPRDRSLTRCDNHLTVGQGSHSPPHSDVRRR